MRLRRLDLTRFGKFTDHRIDFGEKPSDAPDLHIVYGPNEAGKSTALAAFLDLLFGIGTQSGYGFRHPYATMRIGAALELSGGARDLVRIKRPQNSLLDGRDQPLPEALLQGELGGIDRAAYQTMFSLDDETLEAGGKSILASKGDLGQLLFSASSGLADLSRSLVALRVEADGFYKYRARSGDLAELNGRLAALKEQRERIDTLAPQYVQWIKTRDAAAAHYETALAQRRQTQGRIDEIQRLLNALPRLTMLRGVQASLHPLAGLPMPPPGWAEDLPRLQQEEIELATRAQGLADEIARLVVERERIVIDDAALGQAERVARLAERRARHVTAEKDIPERRLQLRAADLVLDGILARIDRTGEANPARLVLGASVVGALRDLIEARSGVQAAMLAADEELSHARQALELAEERLVEAGGQAAGQGGQAPIAALAATVAAVRADDFAARRKLTVRVRAEQSALLADRLRELAPWTDDVEALAEMAVPDTATLQAWAAAETAARKRIDRHSAETERLTTESLRLDAELQAITAVVGLVSDQDAGIVRTEREAAWAEHRRRLDTASADGFEAALRRDDLVTAARLGHTQDLAALHRVATTLATARADLARVTALSEAAEAEEQRVRDAIAGAVAAMTPALSPDLDVARLEGWLGRRVKALDVRAALRAAERDLAAATADDAAARDRLVLALGRAAIAHEPTAGLDALLALADAAIGRETELKALREAVADRRRDCLTRERDVATATAKERAWVEAWGRACADCWLGQGGATPPLATVREIIAATLDLGPALEKRAGLADRIAKMEQDQSAFAAEVDIIARLLAMPATSESILDRAHTIESAARSAVTAHASRDAVANKLDAALQRQRRLEEAQAAHAARTGEMIAFYKVASLGEVAERLRGAERKSELEGRADALGREILDALRLPTIAEAEQVLDAADRTALEADLADQKARFDDQDRRSRDLFAAYGKAVDQLEAVGGDEAVAALEEQRRTVLLEIEDRALRYLRLRAGAAAAEQALRVYRDRHRGSMMARASEAFRTISRGAYTGLATQPDKESETLFAVAADGPSKLASELSKGTRFQLYLALRVAGYHEFAKLRPAVPFIADDIMETFDDFRAEEAFGLLAGMAMVGQVIYFTHHQHLCDIVRRVAPGATIHRLDQLSVVRG